MNDLAFIIVFILGLFVAFVLVLRNREKKLKAEITDTLTKEFNARLENLTEGQEILISQIQPHFLYNVLNTIKYLCTRNPQEALVAIDKFSAFLRKSMDSFNSKECIPFLQEMDIVENYVYLEKCRFGDKVDVIYKMDCTDFSVPSLSVQPMVENAIKHGITKNIGGGQVWIISSEDEDSYHVEIRDNGVGFYRDDLNKEDGKSHIGIKNTKKRIENMCNGRLTIDSEVGSLTRVLISIPKEK